MRASIESYANGFLTDWLINIHKFKSLPGIAEKIAFNFYNPNSPAIYSFGKDFGKYNQEIRNQLHGGMTMVLHRMIDLGEPNPNYPKGIYENADGKRYKKLASYDFNSLYPYAFSQDLPTGPGILIKKEDSSY